MKQRRLDTDGPLHEAALAPTPPAVTPKPAPQTGRRGAPLVCRMAGCTQQLRRSYNQVHRICPEHRRSLRIVAEDGTAWRFCLQCAKLHTLDEFSGDRRSCQSSLLLRRQRKRERQLAEQEDREDSLKLRKRSSSSKKAAAAGTGTGSLPIEAPPSDASDATPTTQHTDGSGWNWGVMPVVMSGNLSAVPSDAHWLPVHAPRSLRLTPIQQDPVLATMQLQNTTPPLPEWQRYLSQQRVQPHQLALFPSLGTEALDLIRGVSLAVEEVDMLTLHGHSERLQQRHDLGPFSRQLPFAEPLVCASAATERGWAVSDEDLWQQCQILQRSMASTSPWPAHG